MQPKIPLGWFCAATECSILSERSMRIRFAGRVDPRFDPDISTAESGIRIQSSKNAEHKKMKGPNEIGSEVSSWPSVSIHPHRFGGQEFRFGSAEIGHVHHDGLVDIPFPRAVRDALLEEGLAQEHYWVPNSGWISFPMRSEQDISHALWLMRLSYLRYALKTAADAYTLFEQQAEALHLSPRFQLLLEKFIPPHADQFVAEACSPDK